MQVHIHDFDTRDFKRSLESSGRLQSIFHIVVGNNYRGFRIRVVFGQPFNTGNDIQRMGFAGCHQVFRIGSNIAGQQCRGKNIFALTPWHYCANGGTTQHHHHFSLIFGDHFLVTLNGFFNVVAVVIRDDFNLVLVATDIDTARGIDVISDNLAAIESRQAPRSVITGHRYIHSDLDRLMACSKREWRKSRAGGQCCGGACLDKLSSCDSHDSSSVIFVGKPFGTRGLRPFPTRHDNTDGMIGSTQ